VYTSLAVEKRLCIMIYDNSNQSETHRNARIFANLDYKFERYFLKCPEKAYDHILLNCEKHK